MCALKFEYRGGLYFPPNRVAPSEPHEQAEGDAMAVHPNSQRAIDPYKRKKGQPALNRSGRNGWSVLREKYRDRLEQDVADLQDVLIAVAKTGDVQALRLALGPILNMKAIELTGTDGVPIDFRSLALKAQENEELQGDE